MATIVDQTLKRKDVPVSAQGPGQDIGTQGISKTRGLVDLKSRFASDNNGEGRSLYSLGWNKGQDTVIDRAGIGIQYMDEIASKANIY